MPPFIQLEGVSKWYGQVIALNGVDCSSDVGILGLLGPNGAGKSSLLKLLAGLARPSRGRVLVFGQPPWRNRRLLAGLGYCPEHHRLYRELSAEQFVTLLLQLNGYQNSEARRLAVAALERVGLAERGREPLGRLSHGMRQRVKLAQAIAHGPGWLVLDEPLTGMDPLGRALVIELVRELAERGVRVVVSSHVLHELEELTADILLLHRGRLLAQGPVAKIRELIDEHPHRIMLKCRETRRLGQVLAGHAMVRRLEFADGNLVVETDRPDEFYDLVGRLAAEEFSIETMLSLDDNLEAVFRYLVK